MYIRHVFITSSTSISAVCTRVGVEIRSKNEDYAIHTLVRDSVDITVNTIIIFLSYEYGSKYKWYSLWGLPVVPVALHLL